MKVSAVILTYNEQRNIGACVASLVGIDDILIVDSGSTDQTLEIARKHGARIIRQPFVNFAEQRNFALVNGKLKNEWILHLDADEVMTQEFLSTLDALVPPPGIDGYRVPSKTILKGRWLRYSGMYPTYQVRIAHRDRMRFKQVGHGQREDLAPERVGTFPQPYLHFNFSHGLRHWLVKHVGYAEAEAAEFFKDRGRSTSLTMLLSRSGTERRRAAKHLVNRGPLFLRPVLRFLYSYILRGGFLDGRVGFQYAFMLACYEAMITTFILDTLNGDDAPRD